jgi:hypothetical protein
MREVDEFGDSSYVCLQCGRTAPMSLIAVRAEGRQVVVVPSARDKQPIAS